MKAIPSVSYSDVLKQEFENKKKKNKGYSIRAFARDLRVSHGTISMLMAKKRGMSQKMALEITSRLGFTQEEAEYFCVLVLTECGRTEKIRNQARLRLPQYDTRFNNIDIDSYRWIADWQTQAVKELIQIHGTKAKADFIARRLSISKSEAQNSLDRLGRLGMIQGSKVIQDVISLPDGPPDTAVRMFQQDILSKGRLAITEQENDERNISSIIFRMKRSDLEWASKQIKNFRRKFAARLEQGSGQDSVYVLAMQLFRLDR